MNFGFITNPTELYADPPGGVQLCSQEFLHTIQKIGPTEIYNSNPTKHPIDRIRRRFLRTPYLLHNPSRNQLLLERIKKAHHDFVFINHGALTRYAKAIKNYYPKSTVILLSHGNQTGDDLFEATHPDGRYANRLRFASLWLGSHLIQEGIDRRLYLDGTITMSEEEQVLEKWLGSSDPFLFPRIISPKPISYEPIQGRIGFIGTLNHTPNRIALNHLLRALSALNFTGEFRLIGGPENESKQFTQQFDFVEYLGMLPDEHLPSEIGSWQYAINPVFWLSRGASMKLRTYLEFGIPTITTESGRRGYILPEDTCITSPDDAQAFARTIISRSQETVTSSNLRSCLVCSDTGWIEEESVREDLTKWLLSKKENS